MPTTGEANHGASYSFSKAGARSASEQFRLVDADDFPDYPPGYGDGWDNEDGMDNGIVGSDIFWSDKLKAGSMVNYYITDPSTEKFLSFDDTSDSGNHLKMVAKPDATDTACLLYTSPSPRDS